MVNALKQITETDLAIVNARIDGFERQLQAQQAQFVEVSNKMAVYEANLSAHREEARRNSEKVDKNMLALQSLLEKIDDNQIKLFDVMGLDGTVANDKRIRANWQKVNDRITEDSTTWADTRKAIIKWGALGFLGLIASGLFLVFQEYLQSVSNAPVVRIEGQVIP